MKQEANPRSGRKSPGYRLPGIFTLLIAAASLAPWIGRVIANDAAEAGPKPNLVIILADDLGLADHSAYGTPDIRTPHIDRLFHGGLTFDNFYANSCVCSPTRAALLSGCYPDRVGVPGVIRHVPQDSWGYLAPDAVLLPRVLKSAGYHSALVGKWHLGLASPNTPNGAALIFSTAFLAT